MRVSRSDRSARPPEDEPRLRRVQRDPARGDRRAHRPARLPGRAARGVRAPARPGGRGAARRRCRRDGPEGIVLPVGPGSGGVYVGVVRNQAARRCSRSSSRRGTATGSTARGTCGSRSRFPTISSRKVSGGSARCPCSLRTSGPMQSRRVVSGCRVGGALFVAALFVVVPGIASAHEATCHTDHTCPSDVSPPDYVCGDNPTTSCSAPNSPVTSQPNAAPQLSGPPTPADCGSYEIFYTGSICKQVLGVSTASPSTSGSPGVSGSPSASATPTGPAADDTGADRRSADGHPFVRRAPRLGRGEPRHGCPRRLGVLARRVRVHDRVDVACVHEGRGAGVGGDRADLQHGACT